MKREATFYSCMNHWTTFNQFSDEQNNNSCFWKSACSLQQSTYKYQITLQNIFVEINNIIVSAVKLKLNIITVFSACSINTHGEWYKYNSVISYIHWSYLDIHLHWDMNFWKAALNQFFYLMCENKFTNKQEMTNKM